MSLNYDGICPHCKLNIGDHTFRGYEQCLKDAGHDYVLPFEDIPGEPVHFPGMEGVTVGEITCGAGFVQTDLGRMPVLRFIFAGPGNQPMSRVSLRPINLIMDPDALKSVRTLVGTAIDRAILGARRGK